LALNPSGIIREANDAAGALLRTTVNALVGQALFRFVADQQQASLRNHFRMLSQQRARQATDLALRAPPLTKERCGKGLELEPATKTTSSARWGGTLPG
jgi:hypothetical protein